MLRPFPQASDASRDDNAESEMNWVMQFILGIRQIRGEMDVSPGKSLQVLLQNSNSSDRDFATRHNRLLEKIGRVESVRPLSKNEEPPPSATALLGDMKLLVPLNGIIDVKAERARLEKKLAGLNGDLAKSRGKLDNPSFVNNAPAEVVKMETRRTAMFEDQIAKLQEQLEKLENLD